MSRKILLVGLVFILFLPVLAAGQGEQELISHVLTCRGLDSTGYPIDFRNNFSLSSDQGVQFFLKWDQNFSGADLDIKWYDSEDFLIQHLRLKGHEKQIVLDYISFRDFSPQQMVIPKSTGWYKILVFKDDEIVSRTEFLVGK